MEVSSEVMHQNRAVCHAWVSSSIYLRLVFAGETSMYFSHLSLLRHTILSLTWEVEEHLSEYCSLSPQEQFIVCINSKSIIPMLAYNIVVASFPYILMKPERKPLGESHRW